jgi:hypothetical protein
MELICVPPERARDVWYIARDFIYAAMKRGNFGSFEAVRDKILWGNNLLWLVAEDKVTGAGVAAVVVTEVHKTEWRKVCNIVACGGKGMKNWIHFLEKIEDYAKAEGCDVVQVIGRPGWERVLDDYKLRRIVLEKDLK